MRKVVYGENTIEITDDSLTVEQIKESLSQVFSELTNATYEVSGDTITFKAAAGTKGADMIYTAEDGSQIMVRKPFIKKNYKFLDEQNNVVFQLEYSHLPLVDALKVFHLKDNSFKKDSYSVSQEGQYVLVHLKKKACPACLRNF